MVVYLHYAHAIGMERLPLRLPLLMDELFSLSISEGAISNILARAREPLLAVTAQRSRRSCSLAHLIHRAEAQAAF
jgi:hypothetical protein